MDEMTVEEACEILTEAEWRGLVWKPDTLSGCKYIGADSENAGNLNTFTLTVDAIAIATGILAQQRMVELEARLKQAEKSAADEAERQDAAIDAYAVEAERAEAELAQVTQGRDTWKAATQGLRASKGIELAALRLAVETSLLEIIAKLEEVSRLNTNMPCDCDRSEHDICSGDCIAGQVGGGILRIRRIARALLATEQKEETPHCWHCGVVLEPAPRPRCGNCPDECDVEDCDAFGCEGNTPLAREQKEGNNG